MRIKGICATPRRYLTKPHHLLILVSIATLNYGKQIFPCLISIDLFYFFARDGPNLVHCSEVVGHTGTVFAALHLGAALKVVTRQTTT